MSEVQMVSIGDYCNVSKGKIGIKKAVPGKYPLVTTAEDRSSHIEYHFDKPSVIIPLVSSTGHGHASLKRIHYQEGEFAVGSILCAVTPIDANVIVANFLYHYLYVYKEELLVSQMKGMANVTLSVDKIKKVRFPLLPIDKQFEWILLFEKAVSFTNGLTAELTHQQTLLKKLRQSILQDAISGKLTKQWQKENPEVEPASELLKRIKVEKERLIKKKKIKKQKPPPPIAEDEIPFKLPKGWTWCRLGEVIELISGQHIEAINYNDKRNGLPYLTGPSDFGQVYPKFSRWTTSPKITADANDLLITVKGSGVGKTNILHKNNVAIGRQLMAVRCSHKYINFNFINALLKNLYAHLQSIKSGQIPGITREHILHLLLALPPKDEINAIILKMDNLIVACDQLESEITKSQQNSEMLMQAVLKEAFEG